MRGDITDVHRLHCIAELLKDGGAAAPSPEQIAGYPAAQTDARGAVQEKTESEEPADSRTVTQPEAINENNRLVF
ncbi:MAG TPA: hypothetical protein VH598_00010 [Verrucomicrobiae bacterium]|nr:hypothetical protein [Verrucomicrobiae bacterium]